MPLTPPIDNILIIKVGTKVLVNVRPDGAPVLLDHVYRALSAQINSLRANGVNVAIICSGAIPAGMLETGYRERPSWKTDMPTWQWLASCGWGRIMELWRASLLPTKVGSMLLTRRELYQAGPERTEALRTLYEHFKQGTIPIINENDPIAHDDIAFVDNDILSATLVAEMSKSRLFGTNLKLILLSDIDGVYHDISDASSVIPIIDDITAFQHVAGGPASDHGTGGMTSKFRAARIVNEAKVDMWITKGQAPDSIIRTLKGEIGSHFVSHT